MPPKAKSVYICSECGYESAKWVGKCPGCGAWNTMEEEISVASKTASVSYTSRSIATAKPLSEISYLDAKNLCQILGMFYDYVDKEAQGTLDTPDMSS